MEQFRTGSSEALQGSPLAYLPTEVLTDMLTFLPIKDIFRSVTRVCQEWRELLMEQPEWWLGLICESLGLDRTGEAGTLVVQACEENRDRSGSSTYFLLAHFLSQLFSPKRRSAAVTELIRLPYIVDMEEKNPEKVIDGRSQIRTVNVSLGREWGNRVAFPGQVLNHPHHGKSDQAVVTLGDPIVGHHFQTVNSRIAVSLPAAEINAALDKITSIEQDEGREGLAYLRHEDFGSGSYSSHFSGVPLFGRTPWADLSQLRRQRVALGLLFMLIDGQELIDPSAKRKHKAIAKVETYYEVVYYPLSMVLEWVLDHVALRSLVQLRLT